MCLHPMYSGQQQSTPFRMKWVHQSGSHIMKDGRSHRSFFSAINLLRCLSFGKRIFREDVWVPSKSPTRRWWVRIPLGVFSFSHVFIAESEHEVSLRNPTGKSQTRERGLLNPSRDKNQCQPAGGRWRKKNEETLLCWPCSCLL